MVDSSDVLNESLAAGIWNLFFGILFNGLHCYFHRPLRRTLLLHEFY